MSDAQPNATEAPAPAAAGAAEPPEALIAAAEEALAELLIGWNMRVAPAAIRAMAVAAIKAARTAALARMHGARHA